MSIAFTLGEPTGIGADLAIIHTQKQIARNLIVFTDPDLLIERAKELNLSIKIKESENITSIGELCVYPLKVKTKVRCGILDENNSPFVLQALDLATNFCLNSKNNALVTGPIHKGIINKAGFDFTGHTEYLAKITGVEKTVMMLATDDLRVALVTTHLPLSQVSKNITTKSIKKTIQILNQSLKNFGVKKPLIKVCGLNPHAGEGGFLGREEIDIINPIIKKLNNQGFNLLGSVPADTAFTSDALEDVDAVLCMYHDQGLPVLKTLGFKKAVNITLGLPFVRTSVDHGTALELAGSGKISLGSFNTALKYAQKLTT